MRQHNRRVLAERLQWPDGVLDECLRVEAEHPDWHIGWRADDAGPVWVAVHYVRHRCFREATGATVGELVAAMAEQDERAARQRAEWRAFRPPGWSSLSSQ